MYGLKQAAILAYEYLQKTLKPFGYSPVPGTVGLWSHSHRPIQFCLCVDDFGVKYFNKTDVDHLQHAIGTVFNYSSDWDGKNFCGMQFDWHYDEQYVDISMKGYVDKALQRLQHTPITPQYSPHHHTPIHYGKKGYSNNLQHPIHLLSFHQQKLSGFSPLQVHFFIMPEQ